MILLLTVLSIKVFAQNATQMYIVTVTLPDIIIKTNDIEISNLSLKYPYIDYNDSLYFPLNAEICRYMGISETKYPNLFAKIWGDYDNSSVQYELLETPWDTSEIYYAGFYKAGFDYGEYIVSNCDGAFTFPCDKKMLVFRNVVYAPIDSELLSLMDVDCLFEDGVLTLTPYKRYPKISIPEFPVVLNGTEYDSINAKYPLVMFKAIVYLPLTDQICNYMGLDTYSYAIDQGGLRGYRQLSVGNYQITSDTLEVDQKENDEDFLSTLNMVNGMNFYVNKDFNGGETLKMEYPPLRFGKMFYIPMTYTIAVENFGWELIFDSEKGLSLDSRNTFRPNYVLPKVYTGPNVYYRYGYALGEDYYVIIETASQGLDRFKLYFTNRERKTTSLDCKVIYKIAGFDYDYHIGDFEIIGNTCKFVYGDCKFTVNMDTGVIIDVNKNNMKSEVLPEFDITINGVKIDNGNNLNAMFIKNDIVYMPLTEEYEYLCGIEYKVDEYGNLYIHQSFPEVENIEFEKEQVEGGKRFIFAEVPGIDTKFLPYGTSYRNYYRGYYLDYYKDYPVLKAGDMYYLPLTYEIVCDFLGWKMTYESESGLVIDTFEIFTYDIGNTCNYIRYGHLYYICNDNLCVGFYPDTIDFKPEIYVSQKGRAAETVNIKSICEEYGVTYFDKYFDKYPPRFENGTLILYTYSDIFEFMSFLEINVNTMEAVFRMEE